MQLQDKTQSWSPPVTPAPDAVAALERQMKALAYQPRRGFIRDKQPKKGMP